MCGQIQARPSLSLNEAGGQIAAHQHKLVVGSGTGKLKKLVYEKVPGQANPADLFTKGVGREKLQQFAWASGQTFLDGRAEKSLQAQGVSKVSQLAHVEIEKTRPTIADRRRASRTIGARWPSGCHTTDGQQIPWCKDQGGVVGPGVLKPQGQGCVGFVGCASVSIKISCFVHCKCIACTLLWVNI